MNGTNPTEHKTMHTNTCQKESIKKLLSFEAQTRNPFYKIN